MAEARFKDYLSMYMGHLEEGDEADQLRQLLNTDREYREEFQNTDVAGLGIEAQDADLRNMNQEQDLDQFLPMRKEAVRAAMAEFGERMPSRSEDPRIHHNYLEKQWFDNREAERKRIRADPELNFKEEMEWWNTDEDIDWANLPRLSPSQSPEEQGAFDMVLQKDLRDLTSKELELRRHLEREREQQQQQPYERQDGGPLMEDYGTIEPYEPSPMEEQTQRIAEFLKRNGISNNASAQRQGENLSMLSEMIPGYGDYVGVREGIDMYQKGDLLGGGIMAVASMLPFIPASAASIALTKQIRELVAKMKYERGEAAREGANIKIDGDPARRAQRKHLEKAYAYNDEIFALKKQKGLETEINMFKESDSGDSLAGGDMRPKLETLSGELMPSSKNPGYDDFQARLANNELSDHDELQAALLQSRNESDNLSGIGEEELAAMQREVKKRLARQEGQNRLDNLKKEFGDY